MFQFTTHPTYRITHPDVLAKDMGISHHYDNACSLMSVDKDRPIYHGKLHTQSMLLSAWELILGSEGMLTDKEVTRILIACLYHAVKHSLGHKSDSENKSAVKDVLLSADVFDGDKETLDAVIRLVEVTEYPYVTKVTTLSEKIMRDADLLTASIPYPSIRLELWLGLYNEMLVKTPALTIEEFAKMNKTFMQNIVFLTHAAKQIQLTDTFQNNIKNSEMNIIDHYYKTKDNKF